MFRSLARRVWERRTGSVGNALVSVSPRRALRPLEEAEATLAVLYLHHPRRNDALVRRLRSFVGSGGSLLGIHSATASFKGDGAYGELLGGIFTGHASVRQIELVRTELAEELVHESSVARSALPSSLVVRDEPYHHEFARDVTPWYRYDGKHAAAWTAEFGSGRVGYFMPGHRAAVWTHPAVESVLAALIEYLVGGERPARVHGAST